MKQPITNIQEVLCTLIKQRYVSIFDYPYMSGFRTRVSELKRKHNLPIKTIKTQRYNKFGNAYTYCIHKIEDVESAKKLYEKLTINN